MADNKADIAPENVDETVPEVAAHTPQYNQADGSFK